MSAQVSLTIGMWKPGCGACFALECAACVPFGAQYLEGDNPIQRQVFCLVNVRHSALAFQREQLVASVEYLSSANHSFAPHGLPC